MRCPKSSSLPGRSPRAEVNFVQMKEEEERKKKSARGRLGSRAPVLSFSAPHLPFALLLSRWINKTSFKTAASAFSFLFCPSFGRWRNLTRRCGREGFAKEASMVEVERRDPLSNGQRKGKLHNLSAPPARALFSLSSSPFSHLTARVRAGSSVFE